MPNGCPCGERLIFACSGAADVGAIADGAARKLTREGSGSMFCLAGVGAKVPGIVKATQMARQILVIDGCPVACGKKCLEGAGFKEFIHLQLGKAGFVKGASPLSVDAVERAATESRKLLDGDSRT